jgi:opacity protein-like surface antigen
MLSARSIALLCFLAFSTVAVSQEVPKVEIFGGYSYLHLDTNGASSSTLNQICNTTTGGNCPFIFQIHPGFNGWNAAGQLNFNSWFGITADISGHYGTLVTARATSASFQGIYFIDFALPKQSNYDFLFGPVFSYRKPRYKPFAHVLMGDERVSFGSVQLPLNPGTIPSPASHNYFAFAFGGGVDVELSRRFYLRAGEFDYQRVTSSVGSKDYQNNFRLSVGLVAHFGVR